MTTCENDHEPISFSSPFSALCPLCAIKREMAEALEAKDREVKEAGDWAKGEVDKAESAEQEVREALDKMEEDRDCWKQKAEQLQAEKDKKEQI